MSVPALALAPVLIDPRTGTGANAATLDDELLDRTSRGDYHAWLAGTTDTGGCVRPVRLRGTIRDLDPATGEILRSFDTDTLPDKVIYTPCGDRRASVCPACAETYRRDTYQLIRAGLAGGKGVPATVRAHPCVFATFTAPGFGPVHTRRQLPGGRAARCRPRRKTSVCTHGRRLSCGQRHKDTDPALGQPLCADTTAASSTWFATVAHPANPKGWDIRWGAQLDTRTITLLIGVDPSTLRRWRTGHIPQGPAFVKISSRVTMYSGDDVRRWLLSRRIDPERAA